MRIPLHGREDRQDAYPTKKTERNVMKIKMLGLMGLMGLTLWGCGRGPVRDEELVQDELTNDITGYSRTIGIERDWEASTNFEKFDVTAEFVNGVGGVERTNLVYRIFSYRDLDGRTRRAAEVDSDWLAWLWGQQQEELLKTLTNE